jgi:hypothetical protein
VGAEIAWKNSESDLPGIRRFHDAGRRRQWKCQLSRGSLLHWREAGPGPRGGHHGTRTRPRPVRSISPLCATTKPLSARLSRRRPGGRSRHRARIPWARGVLVFCREPTGSVGEVTAVRRATPEPRGPPLSLPTETSTASRPCSVTQRGRSRKRVM